MVPAHRTWKRLMRGKIRRGSQSLFRLRKSGKLIGCCVAFCRAVSIIASCLQESQWILAHWMQSVLIY